MFFTSFVLYYTFLATYFPWTRFSKTCTKFYISFIFKVFPLFFYFTKYIAQFFCPLIQT